MQILPVLQTLRATVQNSHPPISFLTFSETLFPGTQFFAFRTQLGFWARPWIWAQNPPIFLWPLGHSDWVLCWCLITGAPRSGKAPPYLNIKHNAQGGMSRRDPEILVWFCAFTAFAQKVVSVGRKSLAEQSANTYFLRIESVNLSKWYSARFSIGRKVHKIVEVAESDTCIFAIFALELDRR